MALRTLAKSSLKAHGLELEHTCFTILLLLILQKLCNNISTVRYRHPLNQLRR